jgi:G3E family GTPase
VACIVEIPVTRRNGCYIDWTGQSMLGHSNVHAMVSFEDGVLWLARVKQTTPHRHSSFIDKVTASEHETIQRLKGIVPAATPASWIPKTQIGKTHKEKLCSRGQRD